MIHLEGRSLLPFAGVLLAAVVASTFLAANTTSCDPKPDPTPCEKCGTCYGKASVTMVDCNGNKMPPFPLAPSNPHLCFLDVRSPADIVSITGEPLYHDIQFFDETGELSGSSFYEGKPSEVLPVGGGGGWTGLFDNAFVVNCCDPVIEITATFCGGSGLPRKWSKRKTVMSGDCEKHFGEIVLQPDIPCP